MMKNNSYTIHNLTKISNTTVRTLRYYDQIGILKPVMRNSAGHRVYGEKELLKLQQILFYKELDIELKEIKMIIENPKFDLENALKLHRLSLLKKKKKLIRLIETIDKTIIFINDKSMNKKITEEDLYKGFETIEIGTELQKEAKEKWDDKYEESMKNIKKMSKIEWANLMKEGEEITKSISNLSNTKKPQDIEVQELIAKHYNHIQKFYKLTKEIYQGLGEMYVSDERFTKFYDKYKPGLAVFMKDAMIEYSKKI